MDDERTPNTGEDMSVAVLTTGKAVRWAFPAILLVFSLLAIGCSTSVTGRSALMENPHDKVKPSIEQHFHSDPALALLDIMAFSAAHRLYGIPAQAGKVAGGASHKRQSVSYLES